MSESPNDSLIPILLLPVAFADLALLLYFIGRFFMPKSNFNRWKRVLIVAGVATLIFILPGFGFWYCVTEGYEMLLLICLPVLLVLHIMMVIWHKK